MERGGGLSVIDMGTFSVVIFPLVAASQPRPASSILVAHCDESARRVDTRSFFHFARFSSEKGEKNVEKANSLLKC